MTTLDFTGLACPMPVIKLKKYLAQNRQQSAEVIVQLSDRGGLRDIPAFCKQQNLKCELVQENDLIVFKVFI